MAANFKRNSPSHPASTVLPVAARSALIALLLCTAGCSPPPPLTKSGMLSNYSNLKERSSGKWSFVSPAFKNYDACIVDQVQILAVGNLLTQAERVEISAYFREALLKMLRRCDFHITESPGNNTARVRVVITNATQSEEWKKLHPASNLAGAGRAGATMEGEFVDSVTGLQIAAAVQSGVGSQFTLMNFSTVSDIKSTIDEWISEAGNRLNEVRGRK